MQTMSQFKCMTRSASTEESFNLHPAWVGSHDETAAIADVMAWLNVPSGQKEGEDETQIFLAKASKDSTDFSININTSLLKFPASVSARSLFQSAIDYVEFHVPAEFIVIDHVSMRIKATVYEAFIPLRVMICVWPTKSGSASEATFSSICGRDIVCFHHLFLRARKFLEKATTSSNDRVPSELEFLDFESEDEKEEMEEDSAKAGAIAEAALEAFIAKLSSDRTGDCEEAASVLAMAASDSPGCRRLFNAVMACQPVLSAIQRLLHPRSMAKDAACIEATRYPILSLLACLTKGNYMEVDVARALHSMLAELDLCHCSALVHAEFTSALNGLRHIMAGQD